MSLKQGSELILTKPQKQMQQDALIETINYHLYKHNSIVRFV